MGPHCCFTREGIIETKRFTYCTKNIQFKGLRHRKLWMRGMNPLSFGRTSFCFGQSHMMLRGLLLIYMEICDMSAGSLYRTKPENQCTLQCVEKWQVITCAASSKHTVALQVNTARSERFLTLWIARHEREQRLCLYADTWQVTGPVQWHIEWIRMGFYNKSSTLHLTLQLSTFFLRKKI